MEPLSESRTSELLRRASTDREALDELLRTQIGFLERNAGRMLGRRLGRVVAKEDLVQEVLARVHRSIAHTDFANLQAFRSWLLVLMKHRALDLDKYHFQTDRRGTTPRSLDETLPDATSGVSLHTRDLVASPEPSPSSVLGRKERCDSLWRMLDRIPESYREIIRLTRIEGLTTEEVAVRLGKSPGAVRKTLSRAIQACRVALGLDSPPASP